MDEVDRNKWINYKNTYRQYGMAKFAIDKLDVESKIELLKEAIKNDEESIVLDYIFKVRDISDDMYYKIIEGLYIYFFSTATYPGEYSSLARDVLTNLVGYNSDYKEKISNDCQNILIKAEDDEIVLLVGNLLYFIKSNSYPLFIKYCEESKHQSIKDILEFFED